jgi:hypothetical protein
MSVTATTTLEIVSLMKLKSCCCCHTHCCRDDVCRTAFWRACALEEVEAAPTFNSHSKQHNGQYHHVSNSSHQPRKQLCVTRLSVRSVSVSATTATLGVGEASNSLTAALAQFSACSAGASFLQAKTNGNTVFPTFSDTVDTMSLHVMNSSCTGAARAHLTSCITGSFACQLLSAL